MNASFDELLSICSCSNDYYTLMRWVDLYCEVLSKRISHTERVNFNKKEKLSKVLELTFHKEELDIEILEAQMDELMKKIINKD